jgi:hypothetical protein
MGIRRREGRATIWVLLALLVGLIGGGAYNYQRNLRAEQAAQAKRPLHGYSEADLRSLAAAYHKEVEKLSARYAAARSSRGGVRDHQLLGDQVNEYERVRKGSESEREMGAVLSEREAALKDVERELQARQGQGDAMQVFMRRLLTF